MTTAPASRTEPSTGRPSTRPGPGHLLRAYVALTKPRIIELLLVTTLPAMVLGAHGLPSPFLVGATLLGGALTAGAANTINCYLDRDIDALMTRTRRRPLADRSGAGPVSPGQALAFGLFLGASGTALLGLTVNWLAALLAAAAILFYVFVYTLGLKRRSPSNIVVGGAAGCFPVLVGWAAVTGGLALPPVLLATVVFLWTPPHFWALAMRFRDDYGQAHVPMLPVVASPGVVTRKILVYSYAMVVVSLALVPYAGRLYAACAVALGGWFLLEAHRLHAGTRTGGPGPRPMRLFHASITYLTLLFTAVAASVLV